MNEMELDIVSQLLEMDNIDLELNNKENVNIINKDINSNDEKSEEEIKNELELIKKRMDQLQKQLQEKKLQENLQKTSSRMSKNEKQILNVSKTNKLQDIGIDILVPEPTSILTSQANKYKEKSEIHSGETDTSDDEMNEKSALSETGQKIKKTLNEISKLSNGTKVDSKKIWINNMKNKANKSLNIGEKISLDADRIEREIFSDLRIINPLVSSSLMKSRMEGRKFVRMSTIRLHMKGNDIEGDWVTIGVIVKKVPTNTSKKGNKYSIWKMSDLKNCEKFVNFFLFGEVHNQHWKTSIGTVVGFLNANIMTDRNKNSDEISFSVDHPGKVMMIGTSKDLGQCKSKRKDGASCQNIVNLIQGDYCQYHVKQEYRKLSVKRMDLQSSYSGTEPKCLKKTILNKQPIFYGGQMFVSNPKKSTNKKNEKKGQLTLDNLKLQKQAESLMKEEKDKCLKIKNHNHLNYIENDTLNHITPQSSFLKQKLSIPTVGSRNFLKYLVKDKEEKEMNKDEIKSITPKELLKLHKQQLEKSKQQMKLKHNLLNNSLNTTQQFANIPYLGRDINPGEFITLDLTKQKAHHSAEIAKLKAINIIQEQGKINPNDPNAVKKKMSHNLQEKVKKRLLENNTELKNSPISEAKKSRLSDIDLNSEKVQEILNRKSSHAYEVELEDLEKQDKYFNILEKKEQMEEKMQSITEITCDVISCKKCLYTAYQPSELCKTENHPLKRHKAIKRFFCCSDCNHRTFAFTKLPKKSCRKCGGSNFEKTSMMKPKEGIKLSHENLLIRGIEEKFL